MESDRGTARDLKRLDTRGRLVSAALEIFSRHGTAATTKDIARAADVNEVTLFRHFETKEQLLSAVVAEVFRAESEALDRVDFQQFDLRRDLTCLAAVYYKTTERYQAFSLTMLAQPIKRELARKIVREVKRPVREKFLAYLAEGQRRGLVRDIPLKPAVDAFTGMIFSGVLRASVHAPGYSKKAYLDACVSLFLHGVRP